MIYSCEFNILIKHSAFTNIRNSFSEKVLRLSYYPNFASLEGNEGIAFYLQNHGAHTCGDFLYPDFPCLFSGFSVFFRG